MQEQNYKTHRRFIPLWHYITSLAIIALLIGSINNVVQTSKDNLYSASLLVLVSVILLFIFRYARVFALKAQDRAIRAEENFRHYLLTGKPFDSRLTIRQIIGLRFASDEEFVELAKKAADEGLKKDEIKKLIKNWRADHYRV